MNHRTEPPADYVIMYRNIEYKIYIDEHKPPELNWKYSVIIKIYGQEIHKSIAPYYPSEYSIKKLVYYCRYEDDERYVIGNPMHLKTEISKMVILSKIETVNKKTG